MAEPVSREHLIERLAEISHATWIVQGVAGGRTLENPYHAGPVGYADTDEGALTLPPQPRSSRKCLRGKSLAELSDNHRHSAGEHDTEPAENDRSGTRTVGRDQPLGEQRLRGALNSCINSVARKRAMGLEPTTLSLGS